VNDLCVSSVAACVASRARKMAGIGSRGAALLKMAWRKASARGLSSILSAEILAAGGCDIPIIMLLPAGLVTYFLRLPTSRKKRAEKEVGGRRGEEVLCVRRYLL